MAESLAQTLMVSVVAALLMPLSIGATATDSPAFVDPILVDQLAPGIPRVAILVLEPGAVEAVLRQLDEWGLPHHRYDELAQASVVLPGERLVDVAGLDGVRAVYRNEEMRPTLDKAAPYIGASLLWNNYKVTGSRVRILIVDTGVDGTHPDVRYGQNLVENAIATRLPSGLVGGFLEGVPSSDVDGHGTHVAGIAGGRALGLGPVESSAGRYRGIAWGGELVGFQAGVINPSTGESGFDSLTVLEAYEFALRRAKDLNIRVVSNSWGGNGPFEPNSPINQATLRLYRAGLVVTFAAGNEGSQGEGTLNRYCVAPWVLCVGAGDYVNQRSEFSSRGTDPARSGKPYDHPDLLAPGVRITAARSLVDARGTAGDALATPTEPKPLYTVKSGTSMATPMVSGVAALLLSTNPKLSPDDVYDLVVGGATPTPALAPWEAGAGYLNALAAHEKSRAVAGTLDAFLGGRMKYGGALSGDPEFARDAVTVGLGENVETGLKGPTDQLLNLSKNLVGTTQGLTLLVGATVLSLAAFRVGRRPGGAA